MMAYISQQAVLEVCFEPAAPLHWPLQAFAVVGVPPLHTYAYLLFDTSHVRMYVTTMFVLLYRQACTLPGC